MDYAQRSSSKLRNPQPDSLQFRRRVLSSPGPVRQVLRMVRNEAQRQLGLCGPSQRPHKCRQSSGRDPGQIAIPGAQGIGGRAGPLKLGQRGLVDPAGQSVWPCGKRSVSTGGRATGSGPSGWPCNRAPPARTHLGLRGRPGRRGGWRRPGFGQSFGRGRSAGIWVCPARSRAVAGDAGLSGVFSVAEAGPGAAGRVAR